MIRHERIGKEHRDVHALLPERVPDWLRHFRHIRWTAEECGEFYGKMEVYAFLGSVAWLRDPGVQIYLDETSDDARFFHVELVIRDGNDPTVVVATDDERVAKAALAWTFDRFRDGTASEYVFEESLFAPDGAPALVLKTEQGRLREMPPLDLERSSVIHPVQDLPAWARHHLGAQLCSVDVKVDSVNVDGDVVLQAVDGDATRMVEQELSLSSHASAILGTRLGQVVELVLRDPVWRTDR